MSFSSDPSLQTNQLPLSIDFPEEQPQFLERLGLTYKQIVDAMNTKEGSIYLPIEQASYIQYFPSVTSGNTYQSLTLRPGYRITIDMGIINSGATATKPHGLDMTTVTAITRMYGGAITNGPFYIPIPYASATDNQNIELYADNTNVTVINGAGQNKINQCYVVMEYLRN